jgi:pilus assembly protein Flp/PilA
MKTADGRASAAVGDGTASFLTATAMLELFKKLLREDDGPTAVEYAVMLALIVAACVGAVNSMAQATADSFDASAQELDGVLG